ncbi:MAG TPA: hypothetical protein VI793_06385, partial [Anaerolineales bacterium]|nr:hypothetical protein [Anaerolineales bacterium]
EWNSFFGRWLAEFARGLSYEDVQNHILNPIHGVWKTTPRLTADLLRGYIFQQVGSIERLSQETHQAWREIATWVLDSDEVHRGVARRYFDRDVDTALGLLVFLEFGTSHLTEKWPHAREFTDVFSAWIERVGHHPDCFSRLLTMLNTPGWVLAPEPMLQWLNTPLGKVAKPDVFWNEHHNARRTAKLLQRVWSSYRERLTSNPALVRIYSQLLDELVVAGQPVAARLREVLENNMDYQHM